MTSELTASPTDFALNGAGVSRLKRFHLEGKFEETPKAQRIKKSVILAFLSLLIGAVNGLFGSGGGMLVVPVLTFVAALPAKNAHATAIAVILPLCIVSSAAYLATGSYDTAIFAPTIAGVVLGSLIGSFALKKVSNVFLNMLFYGVMLFAGLKMLAGA